MITNSKVIKIYYNNILQDIGVLGPSINLKINMWNQYQNEF